jgi:hypothetical protein
MVRALSRKCEMLNIFRETSWAAAQTSGELRAGRISVRKLSVCQE